MIIKELYCPLVQHGFEIGVSEKDLLAGKRQLFSCPAIFLKEHGPPKGLIEGPIPLDLDKIIKVEVQIESGQVKTLHVLCERCEQEWKLKIS